MHWRQHSRGEPGRGLDSGGIQVQGSQRIEEEGERREREREKKDFPG